MTIAVMESHGNLHWRGLSLFIKQKYYVLLKSRIPLSISLVEGRFLERKYLTWNQLTDEERDEVFTHFYYKAEHGDQNITINNYSNNNQDLINSIRSIRNAFRSVIASPQPPKRISDITSLMKDSADDNPERMLERIMEKGRRHLKSAKKK